MAILNIIYYLLFSLDIVTTQQPRFANGPYVPMHKPQLGDDDARFSMHVSMSDTKLPPTPVLMNAVELCARYTEMNFLGRAPLRRGIVLPRFPQIEIAVLPAPPARSVEVRLLVYAIYSIIVDMIYDHSFYECEAEVSWENSVKAHVYFTLPVDHVPSSNGQIRNIEPSMPANAAIAQQSTDITEPLTSSFEWQATYKPGGLNISPNDVFMLAFGAMKVIAPNPITDKVPGAFHVSSDFVDANLQVWLQNRRIPRPTPPFLRFTHVLEAVRRIPGWELERRRFAEFFCSVESNGRPLGLIMMEKGAFQPGNGGNLSTS
ncbi:MAG: hypothetical protein Q9209_007848 [Squamulea sp. 1 TL-2023]